VATNATTPLSAVGAMRVGLLKSGVLCRRDEKKHIGVSSVQCSVKKKGEKKKKKKKKKPTSTARCTWWCDTWSAIYCPFGQCASRLLPRANRRSFATRALKLHPSVLVCVGFFFCFFFPFFFFFFQKEAPRSAIAPSGDVI
jgi:hypothetical protein